MKMQDDQELIAIIGAACRLSGEVSSLGTLRDMISNARMGHCKVPEDRWDADKLFHPDRDRKSIVSLAGLQVPIMPLGSVLMFEPDGCQARVLPQRRRWPV